MKKKSELIHTNIRIPEWVRDKIDKFAESMGFDRSTSIRLILKEWAEK
jgi:antitoxin component of RelBE/YafQ-DinJ toxin-antitoxin module